MSDDRQQYTLILADLDKDPDAFPLDDPQRGPEQLAAIVSGLISELEDSRVDASDTAGALRDALGKLAAAEQRASATRELLDGIQKTSSQLTDAEGEVADHADSGGRDDDAEGIQLLGVVYKLRRRLSSEIFASRAVTAALSGTSPVGWAPPAASAAVEQETC